jgi:hypothetical protein
MKTMRVRPRHVLSFLLSLPPALAFFFLLGRIPPASPAGPAQSPFYWDILIHLKTEGDYKLDEGGPAVVGRYSFLVRWTGWLEKDDHDYLLYHLDSRLCDWEAQETASLTGSPEFLTTKDFRERPVFILKYIIREGENLNLDFLVERMAVPQSRPQDAFPLLLPASEQNRQRESEVNYNACIIRGSNRVELPESAIYAGPVDKTFTWAWKHQKWLPLEGRAVFTSQSHQVVMNLAITPRVSRPKNDLH